jgi:hypothetical protein
MSLKLSPANFFLKKKSIYLPTYTIDNDKQYYYSCSPSS